jgi:hypothetical protein
MMQRGEGNDQNGVLKEASQLCFSLCRPSLVLPDLAVSIHRSKARAANRPVQAPPANIPPS